MHSSLATALLVLTALKTVAAAPHDSLLETRNPTGTPWLNNLAQKHGKLWFGAAADIPGPEQEDAGYMAVLDDTNIFGEITPANYMKVSLTLKNILNIL